MDFYVVFEGALPPEEWPMGANPFSLRASYLILVLHIFRDDYFYYGIYIFKGVKYHQYTTSHLGKQYVLLERDAILKVNYS